MCCGVLDQLPRSVQQALCAGAHVEQALALVPLVTVPLLGRALQVLEAVLARLQQQPDVQQAWQAAGEPCRRGGRVKNSAMAWAYLH